MRRVESQLVLNRELALLLALFPRCAGRRGEHTGNLGEPFFSLLARPVLQFAQLQRVRVDPLLDKLGEFLFQNGYFRRIAGKVFHQPVRAIVKVDLMPRDVTTPTHSLLHSPVL